MVDRSSVTQLLGEVGATATAGMIDRFLDMLPARVARLRRAVAAGELPELRDATLSLGCSATMLGAHPLAAACGRCRTTDRASAQTALAEVERVAPLTSQELLSALPGLSSGR